MIRRRVSRTLVAAIALAAGAVWSCKDVAGPLIIAAPSGVTVTLLTPTSARITWVAPPEAIVVESYNVIRDGTKIGETGGTSFVDNGLVEGVTYRYQVSANGITGELSDLSAESPAATITVPDVTPPAVLATSPGAGASAVARVATIAVTFSENLDPTTINTTTFTVKGAGGVAVPGAVTYIAATRVAEFKADGVLPNSAAIAVSVTTGVKDPGGNRLASDFSFSFSTRDEVPPVVTSTSPANAGVDVPVSAAIAVTFDEPMDPATITATSLSLRVTGAGIPVAAAVTYVGNTATLTPSAPLSYSTSYTVAVTTAAKDLAGNALASDFSSEFSTAAQPDATPPAILSTVPANGAVNVPVGAAIAAAFTETMDQASINAGTFTLRVTSSGALVSGVVGYDASGNIAIFTPAASLAFGAAYTATITTGAKDLAGNPVASETSWSFVTASAPDVLPPTVVGTAPADGAGSISVNAVVTVTFSEAMDANTINSTTVRLTNNTTSTAVTGVVSYNSANNTATFTPNAPLAFASAYSITVTTGAKDASGNSVATAFSAVFATAAAPDTSPPTVLVVTPANGAANVAVGTTVTVTFSEPMNASTINTTTFNLRAASSGTLVGGSIGYDAGTNTATFTPSSPLAFSTGYTVTVTTGAKDLAGNSLSGTLTSGFTTGVAPDTTPPTVSATIPTSGATNVAVTTTARVTFSETMSAGTINGTTIRLRNTATSADIAGAVSFNSGTNTATFTPNASLVTSTSYTIVVSTGVKDQAGNSLASTFTSSFTTVAAADNTAPTVISTSPANGSQDPPPDGLVTVTFSEAMNATTINTSTFLMVHASNGSAVPGTVTYNPTTRVATFSPSTTLYFEDYTATVTTGVRDVAGNALAQNVSFTFKNFASVPNLTGYWSGTTLDGSLHIHVTVDHSTGGATFSLRPNGCAGRQDECRVYPLTAQGQAYLNSSFPADVTSANGTFNDPQTTITFTANGIVFTFTATVSEFYGTLSGTISGGTLPTQSLTMTRAGP